MDNNENKKASLRRYYIIAVIFYIIAIAAFIFGRMQGSPMPVIYLCTGAVFLCLGSTFAKKGRLIQNENKTDDSTKP